MQGNPISTTSGMGSLDAGHERGDGAVPIKKKYLGILWRCLLGTWSNRINNTENMIKRTEYQLSMADSINWPQVR